MGKKTAALQQLSGSALDSVKSGPDHTTRDIQDTATRGGAVSIEHVREWLLVALARDSSTLFARASLMASQGKLKLSDVFAVPTANGACCAARSECCAFHERLPPGNPFSRRFAAPAGLTNPLARVACAWHSRRGQRPSQEDRVTVIPDLAELPGCDDPRYSGYAYMGIFDGHGGDACATYLQRELHAGICRRGAQLFEDTRQAVARAFRETDERCCARLRAQDDGSGSTAVVCLFDGPGRRLVVAHAGDSRCVLGARGARGASLTQDHRLTRADELARVRGAGGLVVNHRLHGTLAVSRSFGDVAHKSGEPPVLTATPEVRIQNVTEEDEFVVLGCDGLWDALSARVVANFIRGELNDHGDLQRAARAVTEEALRRGSVDNVSVILVALNHGDGDDDRPGSAAGAAEEVD